MREHIGNAQDGQSKGLGRRGEYRVHGEFLWRNK
jgi:hypothetical protein